MRGSGRYGAGRAAVALAGALALAGCGDAAARGDAKEEVCVQLQRLEREFAAFLGQSAPSDVNRVLRELAELEQSADNAMEASLGDAQATVDEFQAAAGAPGSGETNTVGVPSESPSSAVTAGSADPEELRPLAERLRSQLSSLSGRSSCP